MKRTLFFNQPAYLSTRYEQLIVRYPDQHKKTVSVPIEDIAFIVLENLQITISNSLISKLAENKVLLFTCDNQHMPISMTNPIVGNTLQSERIRYQINASLPLRKHIWKQTIVSKIENQASHLIKKNKNAVRLVRISKEVKSDDSSNCEAIAAAYYFQNIFDVENFSRKRFGIPPNNLLNYGYSILRGIAARAIISTGLLVTLGIRHKNKYNPFCLADDIVEPYRPFVDFLVNDIVESKVNYMSLNSEIKNSFLRLPTVDVLINRKKSPLITAMSITTNSLYECFASIRRNVIYPRFP
ncbi:MAG: type II CRISPR-associated endonuclease Cas1 [Flavobacteriaceae bacterium]|nr:type II CRISPR-associated endonuclease Cas1 [Flavobacteriaceae bacterium]